MIKINISEYFHSIQGEGISLGKPILFIRLSGCNLKCNFCDSQYHTDIKYTEINKELDILLKNNKKWCITGGEPLLQQDKLIKLIEKYNPYWIEIETNGTIRPLYKLLHLVNQWNISPKNPEQNIVKNIKYNFLEYLQGKKYRFNYSLKFVYNNKNDEQFIEKIIDKYIIDNNDIFIMPEGKTKKEQEKNMPQVIKYCLNNNFNFTPRIHILVWDNKRKV